MDAVLRPEPRLALHLTARFGGVVSDKTTRAALKRLSDALASPTLRRPMMLISRPLLYFAAVHGVHTLEKRWS